MNQKSEVVEISAEQLKISKGPWSLLDCRVEGLERLTIINADEKVVCRIENTVSGKPLSEEDVNNAHVILCLPQLLAEFKKTR